MELRRYGPGLEMLYDLDLTPDQRARRKEEARRAKEREKQAKYEPFRTMLSLFEEGLTRQEAGPDHPSRKFGTVELPLKPTLNAYGKTVNAALVIKGGFEQLERPDSAVPALVFIRLAQGEKQAQYPLGRVRRPQEDTGAPVDYGLSDARGENLTDPVADEFKMLCQALGEAAELAGISTQLMPPGV